MPAPVEPRRKATTAAMGLLLIVAIAAAAAHCVWVMRLMPIAADDEPPARNPFAGSHNLSRAFVISMRPAASRGVADSVRRHLGIPLVAVVAGVNGSDALRWTPLPLYTRMLMRHGRHDHMQLSSAGMLGCLLSHIKIWRRIAPNETVAVFEEDATFDRASAERWLQLAEDLSGTGWELLILESGHIIASGTWRHVGEYAATCAHANLTTNTCIWFGTRGYLLTHAGAQRLLLHAEPLSVQVDALMTLVAAFEPGAFRMFWTRADVAHQNLYYVTQVWDGCIKCFLPQSPLFYIGTPLVWALSLLLTALGVRHLGHAAVKPSR